MTRVGMVEDKEERLRTRARNRETAKKKRKRIIQKKADEEK